MNERPKRLPVAEQIRKGLEEAILHAQGKITLKMTVLECPDPPPEIRAGDVTRLRQDHKLSQAAFARLLNVSTKSVQNWELGIRKPSGAAVRLIQVFRQNPSGVFQAVGMPDAAEKAIPKREVRNRGEVKTSIEGGSQVPPRIP